MLPFIHRLESDLLRLQRSGWARAGIEEAQKNIVLLQLAAAVSAAALLLGMLMGFDLLIPGLCLVACGVQACALHAKRITSAAARVVRALADGLRLKFSDVLAFPLRPGGRPPGFPAAPPAAPPRRACSSH